MEVGGVDVGQAVKIAADASGLLKSAADAFKSVREGIAVGKPKSMPQIASAVSVGEENLTKVNERVLELQNLCAISNDRGARLAKELADAKVEKDAIEDKLRAFETFDETSAAFVEVALAKHSVAIRQSAPLKGKISSAYFCPNCFGNRKYTVLSFKEHVLHADKLECNECHTAAFVARDDGPMIMTAPIRRGDFSPHGY